MKEIEEKMKTKLDEIGTNIDGCIMTNEITNYLTLCENIGNWTIAIANESKHIHLAYAPMFNSLYSIDRDGDPRLWCLVYRELKVEWGYPMEAYLCLNLSIERIDGQHVIKYNNVNSLYDGDGGLKESHYGFAMAGIEEDWWDIDEISGFKRQEEVTQAQQIHHAVNGIWNVFEELFGSDNSIEGWLHGESIDMEGGEDE